MAVDMLSLCYNYIPWLCYSKKWNYFEYKEYSFVNNKYCCYTCIPIFKLYI